MTTVPASTTAEVIELSDSDGSYGTPSRSVAEHVAAVEWVRRSTRARKASTRFSPERVESAPVKRSAAAVSRVKRIDAASPDAPSQSQRKRLRSSSYGSDCSADRMDLIDPQVLTTYVDKYNVKVRPGKFGINMPVGPDEFVLVDAVDYLRNLGYSGFEENEDEKEEDDGEEDEDEEDEDEDEDEEEEGGERLRTDFMMTNRIKEEVLFEPQAIVKAEDDEESEESLHKQQEVNFWDGNMGLNMELSSQSQNQDSSYADSVSQKSTEGSIDVEALDPRAFHFYQSNVKVKLPPKKSRKARKRMVYNDDEHGGSQRRSFHNMMEKQRRREMATNFDKLYSIVFNTDCLGTISRKTPKIQILSGAVDLISDLKRTQLKLVGVHSSLEQKKTALWELLQNLKTMLDAKKVAMNKLSPNQQLKNYVNSL